MLAIGRADGSAEGSLLDEPSLGLAPIIINEIFKELTEVNKLRNDDSIVEQNARKALLLSHRAYVLQTGKITMEGNSPDLLKNPEIEAAYLGGKRNKIIYMGANKVPSADAVLIPAVIKLILIRMTQKITVRLNLWVTIN